MNKSGGCQGMDGMEGGMMCPSCGEGTGWGMGRRGRMFYTRKEKREWLEEKIREMEMELAGMKEKLDELK